SMERAINETNRRRKIQVAYNTKHGITPKTIIKKINDITEAMRSDHDKAVGELLKFDSVLLNKKPRQLIRQKEAEMENAVKMLDFETAAILRDEVFAIRRKLGEDPEFGKVKSLRLKKEKEDKRDPEKLPEESNVLFKNRWKGGPRLKSVKKEKKLR
ncbi:MAG: UvrB/UvrC motif-containing protein, partial [bacterium]